MITKKDKNLNRLDSQKQAPREKIKKYSLSLVFLLCFSLFLFPRMHSISQPRVRTDVAQAERGTTRGERRAKVKKDSKKKTFKRFFSLKRQPEVREHADAEQPADHGRLRRQGARVAPLRLARLGVVLREALLGGVALFFGV